MENLENPNSILETIKKLLSVSSNDHSFDTDIITHINSVFLVLNDLGIGPSEPFEIVDEAETWEQFDPDKKFSLVKSYIYLKVRLLFDPPATSFALDAMQKQIDEYSWRLNVRAEGAYKDLPSLTSEPSPLPY